MPQFCLTRPPKSHCADRYQTTEWPAPLRSKSFASQTPHCAKAIPKKPASPGSPPESPCLVRYPFFTTKRCSSSWYYFNVNICIQQIDIRKMIGVSPSIRIRTKFQSAFATKHIERVDIVVTFLFIIFSIRYPRDRLIGE